MAYARQSNDTIWMKFSSNKGIVYINCFSLWHILPCSCFTIQNTYKIKGKTKIITQTLAWTSCVFVLQHFLDPEVHRGLFLNFTNQKVHRIQNKLLSIATRTTLRETDYNSRNLKKQTNKYGCSCAEELGWVLLVPTQDQAHNFWIANEII